MRVHGWIAASSIAVGIAVLPSVALAANTSSASASASLGNLQHSEQSYTKLNAQIALLKKKLQIAQLQSKIRETKHNQNGSSQGQGPQRAPQGMPPGLYREMMHQHQPHRRQQQQQPAKQTPLPEIVSVEGMGSHLTAVLRLPSGNDLPVQAGSSLPHGAVVHAITPNGVTVKQGGKIKSLSLASGPTYGRRQAPNTGGPGSNGGGRPRREMAAPTPPSLPGQPTPHYGMSPPPGPGKSNAP